MQSSKRLSDTFSTQESLRVGYKHSPDNDEIKNVKQQ